MNNQKSLLVVGGTGVISFSVVNEALKQGYKVTCINRGKSKSQTLSKDVEIFISDYRNEERIASFVKDKHFDAILDVLCYKPADIEYSVSLFGEHCDQYLFFSSAEAYNKSLYVDTICSEDAELRNSLWSYSINKANCEEKLKDISKKYKFKYTIVRPAITYGNTRIPYGVMPSYGYHGTIIQRILNNKPLLLFDGGEGIATFTRVEDFAIGLVGLLGNEKAYNQVFNISGDEYASWKDILDLTAKILGKTPIYINISSKELAREIPELSEQVIGGRAINQRLDNSKLKNAVPAFKTNIYLEEGIKKTIGYYQSHNYLSGIDWRFDATMDRIIKKYRPQNETAYNVDFIDYLNTSTTVDRFNYWVLKHSDNIFIKILSNSIVVFEKIKYRFF